MLATNPECAVYTAMADNRLPDALEDYRRILAAGVNVVGSSAVFLQYPWQTLPDELVTPIEDAAKAGNASLFVNGIDPGFANDLLPLALAGTCQSIEQIRCMEIVDYATYDSATVMFDVMGFGKPLDELPMLLQPGVLSLAWGSVVRQLAAGLGVELDEVSETYVREPAPEDFDIAAGRIAKGSAAALRFEVRGMKGGKPAVVLEHVTRLRDDLRPDWPQPAQEGGSYRVEVTGEPSYAFDVCLEQPQRRSQPRRIGRHRRSCRQRHPRRRRGCARHQNDARLAPHHWKRAVRWVISRGELFKKDLPMRRILRYFTPLSRRRQAPQRHPHRARRRRRSRRHLHTCRRAPTSAVRPQRALRPPNAPHPATSRSTPPRPNLTMCIRGMTSSMVPR